jgi:thymidine phosphorylase
LVASILSKKVAAGSTHLLIDIPVGPSAKVRKMNDALQLRKLFEFVADHLGLHVEVVVSDGRQPIGRGIGPVLELRDVMQVLENDPDAPSDLRQKALRLAGRVIEFDPDVRGGQGYHIARDILDSGRALNKMREIIKAQGAKTEHVLPGPLQYTICAPHDGTVVTIDNSQLAQIARFAGAPMDKAAGVDLRKKVGDTVKKGGVLYIIHATYATEFSFAREYATKHMGYTLGTAAQLRDLGAMEELGF